MAKQQARDKDTKGFGVAKAEEFFLYTKERKTLFYRIINLVKKFD